MTKSRRMGRKKWHGIWDENRKRLTKTVRSKVKVRANTQGAMWQIEERSTSEPLVTFQTCSLGFQKTFRFFFKNADKSKWDRELKVTQTACRGTSKSRFDWYFLFKTTQQESLSGIQTDHVVKNWYDLKKKAKTNEEKILKERVV